MNLARPLARGVSRISLNDPTFSDLAGVLTGVKPVTYTDCSPGDVPQLKSLCDRLKLNCLPVEEFLSKRWYHLVQGKTIFLLGRDAKTVKAAALAWRSPENNERWASILGYPECCIGMYMKWLNTLGLGDDLVKMSFYNTKTTGPLDFKLNNIFNYSSRLASGNPKDRLRYEKFIEFNREKSFPSKHVIGWHPCAYDCPESLKKADVIFSFMERHAPAYAAGLREALARPVLFWDKYRYAFLEGRSAAGTVSCKGVAFPRSLLSQALYRRIAMCDTIKAGPRQADFYRGGVLFYSARAGVPVLLGFAADRGRPRGKGASRSRPCGKTGGVL